MAKIKKYFHVKWAGPNTPYIIFCKDGKRIYLSKRELVELADEINSFTHYYKENFTEDRIDLEDITDEDKI